MEWPFCLIRSARQVARRRLSSCVDQLLKVPLLRMGIVLQRVTPKCIPVLQVVGLQPCSFRTRSGYVIERIFFLLFKGIPPHKGYRQTYLAPAGPQTILPHIRSSLHLVQFSAINLTNVRRKKTAACVPAFFRAAHVFRTRQNSDEAKSCAEAGGQKARRKNSHVVSNGRIFAGADTLHAIFPDRGRARRLWYLANSELG